MICIYRMQSLYILNHMSKPIQETFFFPHESLRSFPPLPFASFPLSPITPSFFISLAFLCFLDSPCLLFSSPLLPPVCTNVEAESNPAG